MDNSNNNGLEYDDNSDMSDKKPHRKGFRNGFGVGIATGIVTTIVLGLIVADHRFPSPVPSLLYRVS